MRDYIDPGWMDYLFGMLVMGSWQAVLLCAASVGLCSLFGRTTLRAAIWATCIVGMLIVPVTSLLFPHCFVAYGSRYEPLHFPTQIARNAGGADALWHAFDGRSWRGVRHALVIAWMAGMAVALLRLMRGWVEMMSLMRLARPMRDARVIRIMEKVVERSGRIRLLQLDGLVAPICCQFHRAVMILPSHAHQLADEVLEMMILHEWGHLRRGDPGMVFVQRLVEVLYWFHPAAWIATSQTSKYREYACDDIVVSGGHSVNDYVHCLGRLAISLYSTTPFGPAALGMVWREHLALRRVKRLMASDYAVCPESPLAMSTLASMFSLVILTLGIIRLDITACSGAGRLQWTAWPRWTAGVVDVFGFKVRDYPLDAHWYDDDQRQSTSGRTGQD
jgi:bla regulator protein BlaR1